MTRTACACLGEGMVEISGRPGAMTIRYGGDVMNTAVYLARAGASCRFLSAVGTDAYSDAMLAMLGDEGVDVAGVARDPRRMPGLYLIRADANGERSFDYWRSDSAARAYFRSEVFLEDLDKEVTSVGFLYFSGITLSLMTADGVVQFCARARRWRESGIGIAFDPNYRPAGWTSEEEARRVMQEAASVITIALPTLEDDVRLFGGASAEECARRWRGWGAGVVAVKCGAQGAYVSTESFSGLAPPSRPVNAIDTTGAGDSFNGAFLASLLAGDAVEDAASKGNALAGKVIQYEGAIAPKTLMKTVTV